MAKPKKTKSGALVYVVLDKSGSMGAIREATVLGVNDFIHQTALADPNAAFHLSLFDVTVKKAFSGEPISQVDGIGDKYYPGGGTALLDGVGMAIKEIEDLPTQPEKVVVVIMTDGQENASREYTREAVSKIVSRHEKKDNWQFLFLGANIDTFAEAGAIGMAAPAASGVSWQANHVGTRSAAFAAGASTSNYLSGATMTASLDQSAYAAADAAFTNSVEPTDEEKTVLRNRQADAVRAGLGAVDKAAKQSSTPK